MELSAESAWNEILKSIGESGLDVQTNPITNKQPLWFCAFRQKQDIGIEIAREHKPCSVIKGTRRISKENFKKVFPFYFKRKQGERISKKVTAITNNQVYIFGLIRQFVDLE